jgi:hypothetical protein
MARADFLTGLVIFALGIYMLFEGLKMPGAGGFIEAGGEPGRVPAMLGAILAVLALILLSRAAARGGHKLSTMGPLERDARIGLARSALTALVCCLYALGLIGATILDWQIKYHQATFVFLFLFIAGFEWPFAAEGAQQTWARLSRRAPRLSRLVGERLRSIPASAAPYLWLLLTAVLQAALITAAVTYLFEQQFYVKLP